MNTPSDSKASRSLSSPTPIDVQEHGALRDGQEQRMDKRLFMQLLVLQASAQHNMRDAVAMLSDRLDAAQARAVLYQDLHDPRSLGMLLWHTEPSELISVAAEVFGAEHTMQEFVLRREMGMLGRTYSSGYEQDLEHWVIGRPQHTARNPEWPWAVWYPLRRHGSFEQLDRSEQARILGEHAMIGRAYGMQDLAHDIRLVCHGLDAHDNDFVIGLIGKDLHRLSHVVQSMRKTIQTSQYIEHMGPFFIGHVLWRSQAPDLT